MDEQGKPTSEASGTPAADEQPTGAAVTPAEAPSDAAPASAEAPPSAEASPDAPAAPTAASTTPSEPPPPAQPAVAWAVPPTRAVAAPRSNLAGIAGVVLLVLGVIGALFGLLIAAAGGFMGGLARGDLPGLEDFPGLADAIGGFVVIVGVIVIVYSLMYLFAGFGVLRSRDWGRIMGIVVAIMSGLVWLAVLASPSDQANTQSGIVFSAILLAAHAYVFAVLTFRWRA